MRNVRTTRTSASHQLADLLASAALTRTLITTPPHALDPSKLPTLTEPLVLKTLRNPSLSTTKKLHFFKFLSASLKQTFKHSERTYAQILRTACKSSHIDEVPQLLRLMKRDGVVVDSMTFKVVLDGFVKLGKFENALDVIDFMEDVGCNVDSRMYDSFIVALVRKDRVDVALSMFFKVVESGGVLGCVACNELLVGLRKSGMREEFRKVFDKLRGKEGFEFDSWGYNVCIHAFGSWGGLEESLRLFAEMKEREKRFGSGGPDLCTYNSLIHVLCVAGKVKDALVVYEELKDSGHEPDEYTYRNVIQGCCKSYRMDDATRIFSEMQYNGFSPDTIVYNSMLDGLFKARKVTDACQLFEKMVQDGVRASCWTYNILIDGLFRNGRAEAAYSLFCDLKKKGQFVDGITYSIVVLRLCKEGELEEALRLVEEMELRGFTVDLVTITSLLIALHKQDRWDWTERLLKCVRDGDLAPSVVQWKADMEAWMKDPQNKKKDYMPMFPSRGNFSDIMNLVGYTDSVKDTDDDSKVMDEKSPNVDPWSSSPHMDQLASKVSSEGLSPNLFSLLRGQRVQEKGMASFDMDMVNTFLSIFLAKGKLSLACKLFEIFRDMGVDPVSYTYNSMMSSFVKKGYFNEAWAILNEMGENLCPADIATYNVIIQGLGKMGRADLASSILDKLTKDGGYLDIVMYNTLINALGKAGRVDEAKKLFEQMKFSGINPDVVTFNTMIEIHTKAGRLKDAYKFLKMMLDAGCSPNHVTDTTLDFLGKEIERMRYQKASIMRNKNEVQS